MASARPLTSGRPDGHANRGRWGAEYRCPREKPSLDWKTRASSSTVERLGSLTHAPACAGT